MFAVSVHAIAQYVSSIRIDAVPITSETTIAKNLGKTGGGQDLLAYKTPSALTASDPSLIGLGMLKNGLIEPVNIMPQSPFYREYQGGIWAETPIKWSPDRRFAIFESSEKLAIVDTQESVVLLNSEFTAFSKSPVEGHWAAIRYRPSGRNQELLVGNEMDTIWFIEPTALAEKAKMVTDANPFAHVAAVHIDGIAIAGPKWSKDGARVAIVRQRDGKILADVFDPVTKELLRTVPLPDLTLTQEQLLSVWIIPEIDRMVSELIKNNDILAVERSQMTHAEALNELGEKTSMRAVWAASQTPNFVGKSLPIVRIGSITIIGAIIFGIMIYLLRCKSK